MPAKADRPKPASLLGRMLANTAWLLGGKGFGALCSLAYLAILARSLGLKDFGHFSLIFASAQALIAFVGFETWRTVVRYGAAHVHSRDWGAFGRLAMLAGLLDVVGALLGVGIAWTIYYQFDELLGINATLRDDAFLFTCAMVFALVSAPTGIVRAIDRFDIAVYVEAVVPLGRLIAAVAIWLTGPSLFRFLFAWAVIDLLEALLYWIVARRLCPQAIRVSSLRDWRRATQDNPGIGRFFLITWGSAALDAMVKQGPLLAVGYLVSTRAAGLFRLAAQLSQGLGKLSTLLMRAAYAEINRARVTASPAEFRKLVQNTSALAAGAGALVLLLAVLFGRLLLELIGGPEFGPAYVILIPLTVAACFELASVAFEPVLHSTGRARHALVARLAGLAAMVAGVALLIGNKAAEEIALAVAAGGAVTYLVLGVMAWSTLRKLERPAHPAAG
jgi:O-antigen/teichoic acid export membrane protein